MWRNPGVWPSISLASLRQSFSASSKQETNQNEPWNFQPPIVFGRRCLPHSRVGISSCGPTCPLPPVHHSLSLTLVLFPEAAPVTLLPANLCLRPVFDNSQVLHSLRCFSYIILPSVIFLFSFWNINLKQNVDQQDSGHHGCSSYFDSNCACYIRRFC